MKTQKNTYLMQDMEEPSGGGSISIQIKSIQTTKGMGQAQNPEPADGRSRTHQLEGGGANLQKMQ
jgi:hypothetical protein